MKNISTYSKTEKDDGRDNVAYIFNVLIRIQRKQQLIKNSLSLLINHFQISQRTVTNLNLF